MDALRLMKNIKKAYSYDLENVVVSQTLKDMINSTNNEQFFHVSGILPGRIRSVEIKGTIK